MQEQYSKLNIRLERKQFDLLEHLMRTFTRYFSPSLVDRLDGITAITLTKDEPLCYQSIEEILPLVNEVIVVDCGDKSAVFPSSDKIQYIESEPHQNTQFKQALLLSKYRWILRWDADFLPVNDTKHFLQEIQRVKKGYWQIKCLVAQKGDNGVDGLQNEAYVFTYHPMILSADTSLLFHWTNKLIERRGHIRNRICYNMLPWFFGMKKTDTVIAEHHYRFKTHDRILERECQTTWNLLSDKQRAIYGSFKEYLRLNGVKP